MSTWKKRLSFANQQGIANQNHHEMSQHSSQNGYYVFLKDKKAPSFGEDVEEKEYLHSFVWNMD